MADGHTHFLDQQRRDKAGPKALPIRAGQVAPEFMGSLPLGPRPEDYSMGVFHGLISGLFSTFLEGALISVWYKSSQTTFCMFIGLYPKCIFKKYNEV